ncbi:MAG: hypothetical protein Q8P49_01540 [Candidatus Liptonbacteria bacterium]|nr:hypothetical protein [Candidatus Liptonbacteria bacterium]
MGTSRAEKTGVLIYMFLTTISAGISFILFRINNDVPIYWWPRADLALFFGLSLFALASFVQMTHIAYSVLKTSFSRCSRSRTASL